MHLKYRDVSGNHLVYKEVGGVNHIVYCTFGTCAYCNTGTQPEEVQVTVPSGSNSLGYTLDAGTYILGINALCSYVYFISFTDNNNNEFIEFNFGTSGNIGITWGIMSGGSRMSLASWNKFGSESYVWNCNIYTDVELTLGVIDYRTTISGSAYATTSG